MVARLITYNNHNNRQRWREREELRKKREVFDQKSKSNNNARCHCLNGRATVNALNRTLNESIEGNREKEKRSLPIQEIKPTSGGFCCFLDTFQSIQQTRPYLVERQKIISDIISMHSYLQPQGGAEKRVLRALKTNTIFSFVIILFQCSCFILFALMFAAIAV